MAETSKPLQNAAPRKPSARLLFVKSARYLTPNMIRITLTGDELEGFPENHEGANCKLVFPEGQRDPVAFRGYFADGMPKKGTFPVRTYTVRHYRPETQELDIDFVAHGDEGPATRWAQQAKPGDFLMFRGPGPVKVPEFYARYYIVVADMSALPVAAATLEAMPREAKGIAVFEIMSEEDKQHIDLPDGIDVHWIVHSDPHVPSHAALELIQSRDWPEGPIQTCIAGEHGMVRDFKQFLLKEKQVPARDTYISGYWKIGLVEDQHQIMKRQEAAASQ